MEPTPLPFEYTTRYADTGRDLGFDERMVALLEERDQHLEDYLAASVVPLVFHWHGASSSLVNVRNGPGEFRSNGMIYMIRYRWDTPPAADATVGWELDGVTAFTHTLTGGASVHVERPGQAYAQEALVSIITAVGSDATGLSAFVYFGASSG